MKYVRGISARNNSDVHDDLDDCDDRVAMFLVWYPYACNFRVNLDDLLSRKTGVYVYFYNSFIL